ncbi:MAG: putative endonuclease [Parcubacteria group bacterium LiPW_39]|nr:MAG: putative endonuclease [Parcubacteria group bacterium LiPW_39]
MDKGLGLKIQATGEGFLVTKPLPPHSKNHHMYYFYVLQSLKDKNLYFGYSDDLRIRFKEHKGGRVPSTKNRRPLELVYYEAYGSEKDARERERQIKKRAKAYISLKRRITNCLLK